MGASVRCLSELYPNGPNNVRTLQIQRPDGTVAGNIIVHATEAEDGAVCAQFELRFEDKPSSYVSAETGMDVARDAFGRQRILVKMEERDSIIDPMRFSIDIPGQARSASDRNGNDEIAATIVNESRGAIQAVRERCRDTHYCDYPVCDMAKIWQRGQLANDGCIAVVVPFPSQSHDSSDSNTQ